MTVTLKSKKPIVVPDAVRRKRGRRSGDPKLPSAVDDYTPQGVMQIIKEAKENPISHQEFAALNTRLMAYGARRAKKAGIKEPNITRVIHESRSRRRTS
jgi:hypothetical protein